MVTVPNPVPGAVLEGPCPYCHNPQKFVVPSLEPQQRMVNPLMDRAAPTQAATPAGPAAPVAAAPSQPKIPRGPQLAPPPPNAAEAADSAGAAALFGGQNSPAEKETKQGKNHLIDVAGISAILGLLIAIGVVGWSKVAPMIDEERGVVASVKEMIQATSSDSASDSNDVSDRVIR